MRARLKGLDANLRCKSKVSRRRVPQPGFFLLAIIFFAFCPFARSQQGASVSLVPSTGGTSGSAIQTNASTTESAENPHPSSVSGVVASKDGELYEGARVTLAFTGPGAQPARSQTTDSDGAFRFESVPPGPFTLTASSNGFATQKISGLVQPGETFNAQTIVLPVTSATTVQVSASQQDIAVEQLHLEEHQRVLGIIPNFYVTYVPDAPPLTTRQKYSLAWMSSIDPITWLATGAFAGMEQADNTFRGYGQGAQGYAKRFGAGYADSFISTMIGGAILPAAFKQDPRYFYKGTGTVRSRILYAVANAIVCKGDNGHWQFDYSGIMGSLAAGGISNIYYPASSRRGVALTFEGTGLGIAGSSAGNLFQEFLVRKLTPRVPHYAPPLQ